MTFDSQSTADLMLAFINQYMGFEMYRLRRQDMRMWAIAQLNPDGTTAEYTLMKGDYDTIYHYITGMHTIISELVRRGVN
jgi:hypothetical protein